jgi:hypothetical protein
MGTLLIAYLLGWAAASAYLGWLALQNARLVSRQDELKKMLARHDATDSFYSSAA